MYDGLKPIQKFFIFIEDRGVSVALWPVKEEFTPFRELAVCAPICLFIWLALTVQSPENTKYDRNNAKAIGTERSDGTQIID
jgi:hypothetical protein